MIKISSKDNQKIKDLIKLRDDKAFRSEKSLFYVEGERLVSDTPDYLIESLYVLEDKFDYYKKIINIVSIDKVYILSAQVYDKVKDTNSSQGIIAVVKYSLSNEIKGDFILALDNIKDPGNLGTIIRLSEATGVDTVLLSNECCDIYNPKTVRSSMSSIFRKSIYISSNLVDDLIKLKQKGFKVLSTALDNSSIDYKNAPYDKKIVVVIGNEANGISDSILKISDVLVKIPMKGQIESLNASIAASIMCYEVMRNIK